MNYIEAPDPLPSKMDQPSLFVAGGISGTQNWQDFFVDQIKDLDIFVINPRRKDFALGEPNIGLQQIKWEYNALLKVDAVSFWFPHETLCPITLFELGTLMKGDTKIFVGYHPKYERSFDIEIQVSLYRPDVQIASSLEVLAEQVREWREQND